VGEHFTEVTFIFPILDQAGAREKSSFSRATVLITGLNLVFIREC